MELLKSNLEKRGFKTTLFEKASDAADYLSQEINGVSVAFGGSKTVSDMNLFAILSQHNEIWWHGNQEIVEKFGADTVMKNAMSTDIYISSVNAVSRDGSLINIDGRGNRIASTVYGHKKVYLLVGKNKVADNFEEALWRARNIAAPKNAKRLQRKTPCAEKGDRCYNCNSLDRICNGFMVIERPMSGQETEIVLINEELGF